MVGTTTSDIQRVIAVLQKWGRNVPEGDGWSWEWEIDERAQEAIALLNALAAERDKLDAKLDAAIDHWRNYRI